jgi:2-polyprenyl-3-methyl-5-hydroxy-6-metoxy-1,4-benzoquinol methylase
VLARKTLERLVPGATVLDIGCGAGYLSCLIAKHGGIVTSTDLNPDCASLISKNASRNRVELGFQLASRENLCLAFLVVLTLIWP